MSKEKEIKLYRVRNKANGRFVHNLTNPHKTIWHYKKSCEQAVKYPNHNESAGCNVKDTSNFEVVEFNLIESKELAELKANNDRLEFKIQLLESTRSPRTKHGHRHTNLYQVWCGIKQRCNNQKNKSYKNYGKRGISICDEWAISYLNFYNWAMAHGYKEGLSIDRINNDGNYEPNNCRWATYQEQNDNTSLTLKYTYEGKQYSLSELSKKLNIAKNTLYYRIKKLGWDLDRALTEDTGKYFKNTALKKLKEER